MFQQQLLNPCFKIIALVSEEIYIRGALVNIGYLLLGRTARKLICFLSSIMLGKLAKGRACSWGTSYYLGTLWIQFVSDTASTSQKKYCCQTYHCPQLLRLKIGLLAKSGSILHGKVPQNTIRSHGIIWEKKRSGVLEFTWILVIYLLNIHQT